MDIDDFVTIGECEIGYTWRVQSENKVVVNIGKVAVYFETDEFFIFAKMIEDSANNLTNLISPIKESKEEQSSKIADISRFRTKNND
ncbi:MAG: hypothetical protein KatS3mg068_1330 [Candidatus Sericytochromatia bacterium]|nr:MAG: hypothetical protein KatS3mg068_1330 [Candidatus Sericytochromatia bacterium]